MVTKKDGDGRKNCGYFVDWLLVYSIFRYFFPLGALIGESICIQKSTAKQIGDVNPVIISDPFIGTSH